MPTQHELETRFAEFDRDFFGSCLSDETCVAIDARMSGLEDGACRKDGKQIFLPPDGDDWGCTLIHEMVHAYVYRFPGRVVISQEGENLGIYFAQPLLLDIHGAGHCGAFFSKLVEVMRARGHAPANKDEFARYFG